MAIAENGTFFDPAMNVPIDVSVKTRRNQAAVNTLGDPRDDGQEHPHRGRPGQPHTSRRCCTGDNYANHCHQYRKGADDNYFADERHPEHGRNTDDNYRDPADYHHQEHERSASDNYPIENQEP